MKNPKKKNGKKSKKQSNLKNINDQSLKVEIQTCLDFLLAECLFHQARTPQVYLYNLVKQKKANIKRTRSKSFCYIYYLSWKYIGGVRCILPSTSSLNKTAIGTMLDAAGIGLDRKQQKCLFHHHHHRLYFLLKYVFTFYRSATKLTLVSWDIFNATPFQSKHKEPLVINCRQIIKTYSDECSLFLF